MQGLEGKDWEREREWGARQRQPRRASEKRETYAVLGLGLGVWEPPQLVPRPQ